MKFLPVASPVFIGNERDYVLDCIDSTWISSNGKYIERFEREFARFCGVHHALSCSNGTVALHLALLALKIQAGDEVIVPDFSYVATANAVHYINATPVFADCEPGTWNIDPDKIENAITQRTKAIIVAHLYGVPARMDRIMDIAKRYGLFVIEDAAEAHGAQWAGQAVGSFGDVATFSFYGNKIITTGEGGMVTTNDPELDYDIRILKGQGQDPARRYWHIKVGYNYRMTNIEAALGLAQLECIEWHLAKRREIAAWYTERLQSCRYIQFPVVPAQAATVTWLYSVLFRDFSAAQRNEIIEKLDGYGIETRPFFYPMHTMPMNEPFCHGKSFPVAAQISAAGINLPTWPGLSEDDVDRVCNRLNFIINHL